MTAHRIVRLQDVPPQPWRNGGGFTHELLAWPQRSDWQLRVSVAAIERSGPFSPYPGVERWFTVLSGAGVCLELPGGEITLTPDDEPLNFSGEAAPMCHLLDGTTLDLNLMILRDAGKARLQRAAPASRIEDSTRWRGLFAASTVLLEIDGVAEPVHAGTLVWSDDTSASTWQLHPSRTGTAFWLSMEH